MPHIFMRSCTNYVYVHHVAQLERACMGPMHRQSVVVYYIYICMYDIYICMYDAAGGSSFKLVKLVHMQSV